jgi:hypothetical protein
VPCSSHSNGRLVYSGPKLVELFQRRDGMTREDAHDWIGSNIEGAYWGESQPIVCWPYNPDESPLGSDEM